jgi:hypothetical protein
MSSMVRRVPHRDRLARVEDRGKPLKKDTKLEQQSKSLVNDIMYLFVKMRRWLAPWGSGAGACWRPRPRRPKLAKISKSRHASSIAMCLDAIALLE